MKRVLLAGYGNIAHAFEKIMNEQEPRGSFKLATCDLKEGQDILHFLPRHHDEFDVVVNTSLANSIKVARMCIDYGLDFLRQLENVYVARNLPSAKIHSE